MLNTYHGAFCFIRWHGLGQAGGTLWVHKSTHHYDLLNWWIDSDPEEVYALCDLSFMAAMGNSEGKTAGIVNILENVTFTGTSQKTST